jgi:hypothetical protein
LIKVLLNIKNESKNHLWSCYLKKTIDHNVIQIPQIMYFNLACLHSSDQLLHPVCVSAVLGPQAEGWKDLPELDPEQHSPLPLLSYVGPGGQVCVPNMLLYFPDISGDLGSIVLVLLLWVHGLIPYILCALLSLFVK